MSIVPLEVADDGALSLTKINDNFDELNSEKVSKDTVGDVEMTGTSLWFNGGGQSEMLIADGNVYIQSRNNVYFGFTTTEMEFYSDSATVFETTGGSNFFFGKSGNKGILDFSNIASSNKTFTFPNKTGVVALVENTNTINIPETRTPASATATGTKGDICWDANYIYVCTATNTWMRAELNTW